MSNGSLYPLIHMVHLIISLELTFLGDDSSVNLEDSSAVKKPDYTDRNLLEGNC